MRTFGERAITQTGELGFSVLVVAVAPDDVGGHRPGVAEDAPARVAGEDGGSVRVHELAPVGEGFGEVACQPGRAPEQPRLTGPAQRTPHEGLLPASAARHTPALSPRRAATRSARSPPRAWRATARRSRVGVGPSRTRSPPR